MPNKPDPPAEGVADLATLSRDLRYDITTQLDTQGLEKGQQRVTGAYVGDGNTDPGNEISQVLGHVATAGCTMPLTYRCKRSSTELSFFVKRGKKRLQVTQKYEITFDKRHDAAQAANNAYKEIFGEEPGTPLTMADLHTVQHRVQQDRLIVAQYTPILQVIGLLVQYRPRVVRCLCTGGRFKFKFNGTLIAQIHKTYRL